MHTLLSDLLHVADMSTGAWLVGLGFFFLYMALTMLIDGVVSSLRGKR